MPAQGVHFYSIFIFELIMYPILGIHFMVINLDSILIHDSFESFFSCDLINQKSHFFIFSQITASFQELHVINHHIEI